MISMVKNKPKVLRFRLFLFKFAELSDKKNKHY
jgi:hypothetical protein